MLPPLFSEISPGSISKMLQIVVFIVVSSFTILGQDYCPAPEPKVFYASAT